VSTTAKRCFAGNVGANASFTVDSELYSELGYGELTLSLINIGTQNYYLSVRVEKQHSLASERYKSLVLGWAGGDQNCPLFDGVPDLTRNPDMKRAHYVPEQIPDWVLSSGLSDSIFRAPIMDMVLSFLISAGIIAFGVWVVAVTIAGGLPLAWPLMGMLAVVVGSISFCGSVLEAKTV
jgi:hypothetical protein